MIGGRWTRPPRETGGGRGADAGVRFNRVSRRKPNVGRPHLHGEKQGENDSWDKIGINFQSERPKETLETAAPSSADNEHQNGERNTYTLGPGGFKTIPQRQI